MFPQYTPNGISLDQLKKDAKKIKKDDNISYLEALDKVTSIKTNFKNWNDLQKFIKINRFLQVIKT